MEPQINWVDDDQATGEIKEIYESWKAANPERQSFPEILKCFSYNADVLKGVLAFCYPLQFADGKIGRRMKELIATRVSAINQCAY